MFIMGRTARKRKSKGKNSCQGAPCSSNEKLIYKKLNKWMLSNKWLPICNLVPHNFNYTGRGVMAFDSFISGQIILKLPKCLLITTAAILNHELGSLFTKSERFTAQSLLAIILVYEKHLSNQSFWKPYLDTMPSNFTNPHFCSGLEKRYLPNFIIDELNSQTQKLYTGYYSLIKVIGKNICNHCSQPLIDIFTFHKFSWAYYAVNTRAVYFEPKKQNSFLLNIRGNNNLALAPFLDLFNHSLENLASGLVVTEENNEEFYCIKINKNCDDKKQLFIHYGAHTSLKLFMEYGFFIPNNPLDEIFFDFNDISKCFRIPQTKSNFIHLHGFNNGMAFNNEGLNYNGKNSLFVISTTVVEESVWKEKIYCQDFNSLDLKHLNNVALQILEFKQKELVLNLENMSKIVHTTVSFTVSCNLVNEYLKIMDKACKNLRQAT